MTACATFPLVFVGGLVTSYDVGMAVPDAPTTFGRSMLLFPLREWLDAPWGVKLEHGHRLFGALGGLLTLLLVAGMWADSARRWIPWLGGIIIAAGVSLGFFGSGGLLLVGGIVMLAAIVGWGRQGTHWRRWLGLAAVGLVLAQGGFGALRVVLNERAVAAIHGCVAQAFFALMTCLALFTSRGWTDAPTPASVHGTGRLQRLALITTGFVCVQLVLGALLRHLGWTWALVAHFAVAFVIVVHVGLVAKRAFTSNLGPSAIPTSTELLGVLVVCQLMLGAAAWATSPGFGPDALTVPTRAQILFSTSHVAVGALILALSVVLTLQCYRNLVESAEPSPPSAKAEDRARTQPVAARPSVSALESRELFRLRGAV